MAYLAKTDIGEIHIESTSKCNLQCPQCARTVAGRKNSDLPLAELNMEFFKRVLPPELLVRVKHIYFCGNYGDPAATSDLLETLSYFKSSGVKALSITTNGSLRTASWWKELAQVLSRERDRVTFSIDGLRDSNAEYRVGTNWERLMENVQAFIGAGGRARWDYLVFPHNEHQVHAARALADELGFTYFNVKQTARFIQDHHYRTGEVPTAHLDNPNVQRFAAIIEKYGTWQNYVRTTPIRCKSQQQRSLYIDFEGDLWPCCWTGAAKYFVKPNTQRRELENLQKRYGPGFNSLHQHSLESVLAHPWFQERLEFTWNTTSCNERLMVCGRTCGQEYEFTSAAKTLNSQMERMVRT